MGASLTGLKKRGQLLQEPSALAGGTCIHYLYAILVQPIKAQAKLRATGHLPGQFETTNFLVISHQTMIATIEGGTTTPLRKRTIERPTNDQWT